jgi:guanylate kinase
MKPARPVIFVVSAPSGAGKTTLCHRLLEEMPHLRYSVSTTTRKPREGEVDGQDYDFVSREQFDALVAGDAFLEFAEVHAHGYGTRKDRVFDGLSNGDSVLLDVDVQGADQIRSALARIPAAERPPYADVFIEPPSLEILENRLRKRGKDHPDVITTRMQNAQIEMAAAVRYQHRIVNDDLETAYRDFRAFYLTVTAAEIDA